MHIVSATGSQLRYSLETDRWIINLKMCSTFADFKVCNLLKMFPLACDI